MSQNSRVKKILLNAKVNVTFYTLVLIVSFFTRKIFLDKLGDDFVGLTTTLKNLLGFLNLAELGVSGAIGYVLYRPIFDNDQSKLNQIISLFGYIYRLIGFVIIALGILLSSFLPFIFKDVSINLTTIYFAYYAFLFSSILGYFANYKQTLLSADQKNYIITSSLQSTVIVKSILQAYIAYHTQNYYIWITIEIIFGIIFSLVLNWQIQITYPWLQSDIKLGRSLLKKYPEVFKYTKQLFVHKLAGFAQTQLTPFLLYAFVSLKTVALYSNYTLIISGLTSFIFQILGTTEASVGNLIAEGDKRKIINIYWELFSIRIFASGVVIFCIYHLINPFVILWLGESYLIENSTLRLICITIFITISRGATDIYKYGYALFSDVWAPIAEFIIFVATAIVGGYLWGFNGVLLGGVASLLIIVWGWQPIFLFRSGLKSPVMNYFLNFIKYIAIYLVCFYFTTLFIDSYITSVDTTRSYLSWIIYALKVTSLFSTIYLLALYLTSKGIRESISRLKKQI